MGPPLAEGEYQRAGASVPSVGVGAQETRPRPEGQPGETKEDDVSEFDDLEKKAEAYAEEHPEQANKGINKVAGFAERDTDHQHDEQIDRAVDAAERHIGRRQDPHGPSWPATGSALVSAGRRRCRRGAATCTPG
jgi:MT0933-like antitoxin protein